MKGARSSGGRCGSGMCRRSGGWPQEGSGCRSYS